jgi:hypothetical protein
MCQKQGATRLKGVGAKGDNSAFPAPFWVPRRGRFAPNLAIHLDRAIKLSFSFHARAGASSF